MRLYHGSNVEVAKPRLMPSVRALDFGRAFYLTSVLQNDRSLYGGVSARIENFPRYDPFDLIFVHFLYLQFFWCVPRVQYVPFFGKIFTQNYML